jgi:gentisate 1,2-dioxygenase
MEHVLSRSELIEEALYLEYTSAVNPRLPPVPIELYKSELHRTGPTRIIPLDLARQLGVAPGPATGPTVSAAYFRICKGESLTSQFNASAQLFYVIRGRGTSRTDYGPIDWQEGDVFVLPMTGPVEHSAQEDTALYHVNDAPLVDYLGAHPFKAMFEPVLYPGDTIMSELKKVSEEPEAPTRNRDAIILGDKTMVQIKSATHTLWAAIVWMNPHEVQRPHRHNSIAVDIVIDAAPGAYTLLGSAIDDDGNIVNPQRVDWESGAAFVTPPHLWHGHYNDSEKPAKVMAVQDAGFYEHLRTLNITFTGSRATGIEYKA